jgi:hypothetical protein
VERIHHLLQEVWKENQVFDEWKDAEVVPIHKKGDFKLYDIWRGISLLDAVGKILARIIQEYTPGITMWLL